MMLRMGRRDTFVFVRLVQTYSLYLRVSYSGEDPAKATQRWRQRQRRGGAHVAGSPQTVWGGPTRARPQRYRSVRATARAGAE